MSANESTYNKTSPAQTPAVSKYLLATLADILENINPLLEKV